ncbi:MAG TPA: hypothetical protein VFJ97_04230 [Dermatophilaceae bacterium]|nr:hypothetical protein [Dermatophilaceae bacterium]
MSRLTAAAPSTRPSIARTVALWLASFAGFPLGGLVAMILSGPVDSTPAAVTGGLLTGTVLGTAQALALRLDRRDLLTWVLATAAGLAIGLAVGAPAVDFRATLGDLVLMGAICGLAVGVAQALAMAPRTGPLALIWPAYLGATWSIGWAVTVTVGVQVEDQFTVFGSAGAIVVTLLTAVLPVTLHTRLRPEKSS